MRLRRFLISFSTKDSLHILAIIMLAFIYLWQLVLHPTHIPMTALQQTTDFLVAHLSYAQYIHDAWFTFGRPPLWNSSMLSGTPLIADPLSGYFYLPNWLTFIFPQPAAYNLLFVLHLAWTGIGMRLFLRSNGLSSFSALFGAAVWMGTPKLIGYIGGGQVSSVFALSWLPWLLFFADHFSKSISPRNAILAGGTLATVILIDIRWGFLEGILTLAFLIYQFVIRKAPLWKIVTFLILILLTVVLLTAVLTVPLSELMLRSDRVNLTTSDRSGFSLSLVNLLGVFLPQFGIINELVTYVGILVILLAILSLKKPLWFWASLAGFGILFSMGTNGILYPIFSNLIPGFDWLRVPSRLWFFVAFSASVLSARGFERMRCDPGFFSSTRLFRRFSFAVSMFAVILAAGVAILFPPLPEGILAFAIILPLSMLLLTRNWGDHGNTRAILLLLLSVMDLLWVNSSLLRSVPLDPAPSAVRWLESQPGLFRVYSPSYRLPVPNRLQTAEGVNPTHLKNYSQYMAAASGIRTDGYSVSVPGIYLDQFSDPQVYELAESPDLKLLGLLNVQYIVSNFPLTGLEYLLKTQEQDYIYRNPEYRERVSINPPGSVKILFWSPDDIVVQANTAEQGIVTFSEIDYPGWEATIDNQPVDVLQVNHLFRGVNVPAGNHTIRLRYIPFSFITGLIFSIIGWGAYLFIWRFHVSAFVA